MVKAAKDVQLVLVDCSSKMPPELKEKYKVSGLPALIYTDSEGTAVGSMRDRSASGLINDFKKLVREHTKKAAWAKSLEEGMKTAKKKDLPLLIFVADEKKQGSNYVQSFFINEDIKDVLDGFVMVRLNYEKGDKTCKKIGAKGLTVYVYDPKSDDPFKRPISRIKAKSAKKKMPAKKRSKGSRR